MSQSLRVATIDTVLWRALAVARSLAGRSPWTARQLRRVVLLLWWTASLQIHIHARYWLRARRLRRIVPPAPAIEPAAETDAIDPASVDLPISQDPLVSIIIPTYGQLPFTLRCLASVANYTQSLPIEVIVIDDAWGEPDAAKLDVVRGIRLVRNETNLGFLRSCNKAAALAKGRYAVFLNNDTQVLDGWLEPMVTLFQDRTGTGAVGAKLLYPDGRLQEAGAIVWQDASGWNFGRLEDPARPEYNYIREVDYCSGAALMVERDVFASLGGFDERYAPAYFEDTDLCFRLRQMGLKVLYQPAARVVHHEGISHGRDTAVGIKSYQVQNRRTFVNIWTEVLARDHYQNALQVFRAKDRSKHRKVVLVIDHYVPTADRDAGSRAIMGCLHIMLQAGFIVKFWPHNLSYSPGYTEILQGMGIEVFHGPHQAPFETWIKSLGSEFDMILVSRPDVAEDVLPYLRRYCRAPVIYYGHDLHFRRMALQASVTGDDRLSRMAEDMRAREYAIWRRSDLSLYLSEEEAQIASALQPDARIASVVPYCFDEFPAPRTAVPGREIVFVAGFGHPPNEDAACWFVADILPLIRAGMPDAQLSIIGSNPTERVRALAGEGVSVTADVSEADLAAAYAKARVAIVPLRCGAGVKMKVVEALRAGLPLVTTPVGAQGLPGLSQIVPVHDDVALFAASVRALLYDDAEWETRSRAQVEFARRRFSRDAMRDSFLGALATVG